jgi:FkbH-like protein
MNELKFHEILLENKKLEDKLAHLPPYRISVLSNTVNNQLKDILELSIRSHAINAQVNFGNYDNIIQDASKYKADNLIIVFWEISNIIEGFQYKINSLTDQDFNEIINKIKSEINMLSEILKNSSLVIFNLFTSLPFNFLSLKKNRLDDICLILNNYISENLPSNFIKIDLIKIFAQLSIGKAIDSRNYCLFKIPYTIDFYKAYSEFICPVILSVQGKTKKVLVMDCDNTLWKGIVGEDGFDSVQMSEFNKEGAVFREIQHLIVEIQKEGVLIGLCSKNNQEDVDEILTNHPDMIIRENHITIKKINWSDKAVNLQNIANELNLGLDSIVFVDDSAFEINFINEKLPQVTTIQVPQNIFEYPAIMRKAANLFYSFSKTKEDLNRGEMYKQQIERENAKSKYENIEDYLKSLNLLIEVYINPVKLVSRISQITQKTNQFNLTTKRYTEEDITSFMKNKKYEVIAINVKDKYGDNGITGLAIIKYEKEEAEIDTLLMSCRIIGRNIEYKFLDIIVKKIKEKKSKNIKACFIKSNKNQQVCDFYDKCNFLQTNADTDTKYYSVKTDDYKQSTINYIQVTYER